MPIRKNMDLEDYKRIFLRRKWQIIFSFLFILFGASVYIVVVPEEFKSSTTILVIPQRVPENYVRSTVSTNIENRLSTIRQQVLSRTCLTSVMDELGLLKEERKQQPLEEVIEKMRKRVDIQVRGNDSFMLSFVYPNRQLAMLTTSRMASFFIDENLKLREQQAVGTSEFLDSQLQDVKRQLEAAEEKVKQYKMRFMGQLPQQMEANLSRLRGLQDRFRANAEAIRAAEDRNTLLEAQTSGLERSLVYVEQGSNKGDPALLKPVSIPRSLVAELQEKRARLEDLSAKYTSRYPEVQRLRLEVEQLERRIQAVPDSAPPTDNGGLKGGLTGISPPVQNAMELNELRRLREQLAKSNLEIASLKQERESIQSLISELQFKVEQAPKREQEMISLTRDYDNLMNSYNGLLRKKLDADISQNLEKRQKGEQFQILDPANMPDKPFKPNRLKVVVLAVLISFLVGFGGVFGLEAMDQTIRDQREFTQFFRLPVLASIPIIRGEAYARRVAFRKAVVYSGIILFTIAITAFLFRFSDKIRLILFS